MYEIARYTERNTMQTATFLERLVAPAPAAGAAGRRILDVDLRRGRVRLPRARPHGAAAPPGGAAARAPVGAALPDLRRASCAPVGTRETKPLIPTSIYAITKRDHEELCLVTGAAYGIPTVALRFFNVYGPGQALSNPYTGVAAIFASRLLNGRAAGDLRGRQPVARLHPRQRHRARDPARARVRDGAAGHADQPRHRAPETRRRRSLRRCPPGSGLDIEPIRNGQYRAGDIRHCFADPTRARELLGFEAADDARGRDARRCSSGSRDQEADDRVDDATRELAARGLAR